MHNIWSFICDYNNRILRNIRKSNRIVLLKIFENRRREKRLYGRIFIRTWTNIN